MCKVYYVIYVKGIMATHKEGNALLSSSRLATMLCVAAWEQFVLMKNLTYAICRDIKGLTLKTLILGAVYDQKRKRRVQNSDIKKTRFSSSASGTGQRRVVSKGSIFRSSRYCPGQVRDVAQGACRRSVCESSCRGRRLFKADFLRGKNGFRQWWIIRFFTSQKRTASCSQIKRYCDVLYRTGVGRPARNKHGRYGRQSVRAFWSAGACEKHKTSDWTTQKKSAVIRDEVLREIQEPTQRYEDLRDDVLTGIPCGHVGLSVMLNQGMWAWISLADSDDSELPIEPAGKSLFKSSSAPQIQSLASRPELLEVLSELLMGHLVAKEAI